jgi:transcriptional regulator with XRE-family HTH domain
MIQDARIARQWTLQELSTHTGVSTSRLSELENGTGGTSLGRLFRIADVLAIPHRALFPPQVPTEFDALLAQVMVAPPELKALLYPVIEGFLKLYQRPKESPDC